jgi:ribosomal protein L11 methyltransferase
LGYKPVWGFDHDPESIRVASANAAWNRVRERVELGVLDVGRLLRRPSKRYSLVCANLLANLLIEHADRLKAQVEPAGRLIVAGILREEFASVVRCYEATGMRLEGSREEGEWTSGTLVMEA